MKTFKQYLTEANDKNKYTILNDYDSKNKRYWYIVDKKGDPIYDDDGNNIHFDSFNKAKEYVDEYLTEAKIVESKSLNESWKDYFGNILKPGDTVVRFKSGDFNMYKGKLLGPATSEIRASQGYVQVKLDNGKMIVCTPGNLLLYNN